MNTLFYKRRKRSFAIVGIGLIFLLTATLPLPIIHLLVSRHAAQKRDVVFYVNAEPVYWSPQAKSLNHHMQAMGKQLKPEEFKAWVWDGCREEVQMVLLAQYARKLGLVPNAKKIAKQMRTLREDKGFQKDGRFDENRLQKMLGLTEKRLKNSFERIDLISQLLTVRTTQVFFPDVFHRIARVARCDIGEFSPDISGIGSNISQEAPLNYYALHKAEFVTPKCVTARWMRLKKSDFYEEAQRSVSEEAISGYYDDHPELFVEPETRTFFFVERLTRQEVKRASTTPGLLEKEGYRARLLASDIHIKELSSLQNPGEISEPFLTPSGFGVVQLHEIEAAKKKTLTECTQTIKEMLSKEALEHAWSALCEETTRRCSGAEDPFEGRSEVLEKAQRASMEGVGEQLDCPSAVTWLQTLPDTLLSAQCRSFTLPEDGLLILSVEGVYPQRLRPFEEVAPQILGILRGQAEREARAAQAEILARDCIACGDLKLAPSMLSNIVESHVSKVGQDATSFEQRIFSSLPDPSEEQPVYALFPMAEGKYKFGKITAIEALKQGDQDELFKQVQEKHEQRLMRNLLATLIAQAKILQVMSMSLTPDA